MRISLFVFNGYLNRNIQNRISRCTRIILPLCFCHLTVNTQAQDILDPVSLHAPKIKWKLTKDPQTLAAALTKDVEGEEAKFDVIFAWVASNVRYDYKRYNSGRSFRDAPIKKVLKKRKGICTDYARLMDTLCDAVGITNTTVHGYAKEIIFDVNDSLYFDNHSWNAVRLSNQWYLYDVTWCAGRKTYELTRFSEWRLRQVEKLMKKVRTTSLKLKIKKKGNKFCGIPSSKELATVDVLTLPLITRILVRILVWRPLRVKEVGSTIVTTNYYLSEPEVFALDHFPNDPIWSLTNRINTVSEFSADSSFYYRVDSIYLNQTRESRSCTRCDYSFFKEPIDKEKAAISSSRKNNQNNHLVPALGNLAIAEIFLDRMIEEQDSLPKMQLFDSTIYYLEQTKSEFKSSSIANGINSRFHFKKNKDKRNILLKENKRYWGITATALRETHKREIKVRSMVKKANGYAKRGKSDYRRFDRTLNRVVPSRKLKPEKVASLREELSQNIAGSDSLTFQIDSIQNSLYNRVISLWENILKELEVANPLVNMYNRDGFYRAFFLMDNYDREIREMRKDIDKQVKILAATLDEKVLQLADSTYAEFITLNRLIKKRNSKDVRAAKLIVILKSGRLIAADSITAFEERRHELMKRDACWNTDNTALFDQLIINFKFFSRQTKEFYRFVRNNDALERSRYTIIDRHITRNKKRIADAIEKNTQLMNDVKRRLYLERNSYLKMLREQPK